MKFQIFTIHDSKAQAFLSPFVMQNAEMAQRTFIECANDKTHMFCKHPTDFTLFQIGTFDDETGDVENFSLKINLGWASNYQVQA